MHKFLLILQLIALSASPAWCANSLDERAHSYFSGKKRIGNLNWFGNNVMGNGFPNLGLGAGFWAYGELADRPYERYAGFAQVESVLATGATIALIKSVSNRSRPDGSDSYSFPSAHSAYAFATASVLGEFYGPYVGVPAYTLAALTAVARMQDNRHWFTDTLGGAAVGVLFGITFSRLNLRLHENKKRANEPQSSTVRISPLIGPKTAGVSFSYEF